MSTRVDTQSLQCLDGCASGFCRLRGSTHGVLDRHAVVEFFTAVASGETDYCRPVALADTGSAFTMGLNESGQLGHSANAQFVPVSYMTAISLEIAAHA